MKRLALVFALIGLFFGISPVQAQGPIVGEIRLWAGPSGTIPDGWRIADGSDLGSATYASLYSVIGCTYGCSGSDFKLPDMKGRVAVGYSTTGADSEFDTLGEKGGEKTHTLTINEMPSHNHQQRTMQREFASNPFTAGGLIYANNSTAFTSNEFSGKISNLLTLDRGGSAPHNNLQPYITLYYIIYTGVLSATPTPTATPTETATPTITPTPTGTITPTATITSSTYLPYIVTTTLKSGTVLSVPEQVSFGQIITSGIMLSLIAALALDFLFRFIYRR